MVKVYSDYTYIKFGTFLRILSKFELVSSKFSQVTAITYMSNFFQNGLKRAKNWWHNSGWFGSSTNSLREKAQLFISRFIQQTGQYAQFPITQLTLQLCFTSKIGPIMGRCDYSIEHGSLPSVSAFF